MKTILVTIGISFLFLACNSNVPEAPKEDSTQTESTTDTINPSVGVEFINAYAENCNRMKESVEVVEWTRSSALVTDNFKVELTTMVNDARAEEPMMGLGFDPIFDAQDYPDQGFELASFDPETGYLVVRGVDWTTFEVTMRLVLQDGKTLVEWCGVVNVPEERRSDRGYQ